jgi:hypothetical protein
VPKRKRPQSQKNKKNAVILSEAREQASNRGMNLRDSSTSLGMTE